MSDYITDYMRQELAGHALELVVARRQPDRHSQAVGGDMELYRMGRPDTGVYAIHIAEFAGRLCIAGDVCLGANGHGLVSAAGYGIRWFAGQLSEAYLCEKFLRQEWQWNATVESIRSLIAYDTAQGEGWWLERAAAIEAFLTDPGWRHDEPSWAEYCERMAGLGHDGYELPGHDYPRVQAGWLCAIQQRFRALHAAPQRPPGFWRRWCPDKGS